MKRKNNGTMREVLLWIGHVIVPGVATVGAAMQIPGVRDAIVNKVNKAKRKTVETKDKVIKFKKES